VGLNRVDLRYLYVGAANTDADLTAWLALPNATMRWRFRRFGADVACVDLGARPFVLLADHRPDGSVLPIYAVEDLAASTAALTKEEAGWHVHAGPLGTPEGDATVLRNASSFEIAILQVDRPTQMEDAYASPGDHHAVRSET
jgi:hypothetical protein